MGKENPLSQSYRSERDIYVASTRDEDARASRVAAWNVGHRSGV